MPRTHIVEQGEHLSSIAARYGFRDFHTIWDFAGNANLHDIRDPHCLFPGDELTIPDIIEKIEQGATGLVHRFVVPVLLLHLRVKALDLDNRPVADASGELKLGAQGPFPMATDGDGIAIHERIGPKVKEGKFDLTPPPAKDGTTPEPLHYELRIGHLNPVKKLSGQKARLNNLGYFAGYELDNLEQLLWAAEEFECDRINESKAAVKKRPEIVGVVPDDQDKGQEAGDPTKETGIKDDKIRTKLKEFHGV